MEKRIYLLPKEFLAKLKKIYPQEYPQICRTFLSRKKHSFRINYKKTDLVSLRKALIKERIKFKELKWPEGSFILESDLRKFQETFIYKDGLVYLQNVSSMIPPLVLEPKRDEKILDLCAAPGAKTTQIFSLVGGEAEIIAVEKIRTRFYKLLANLKIQAADTVKTILMDGVRIFKKYPEYFDKVLLDAPCSSEARFWVNNVRSFKYWKERKVKEMAHKQKKLLASAIKSLKEGGILVYSTCTFSPEENEEIINWALNKFKDKLEIIPVSLPIKNIKPGLIEWKGKKFSSSLKLSLRILPNDFMEGFYIAKLRKIS